MAKSEYIITDQERIACEYFVVSNNKRASYALWRAVIGRTKEIAGRKYEKSGCGVLSKRKYNRLRNSSRR